MSIIALLLFVALLIPIIGIIADSPIGRALARRLEGPGATPTDVVDLSKRIELLESEVDDLMRSVQTLQDESAFLHRLLEDPAQRATLPPPPRP
jgi:hypothetical protein